MRILKSLWRTWLIVTLISLAIYSCGKPVRTINIEELKQIRKSEGAQRVLISNNVRCISADDSNVWIATDRGVSRFERATGKWSHYTKEDGLSSDNINAVASDGNRVWFGTDDGVSQYNVSTGAWRTFRERDGLKGNRVFRIAVDVDYVWFGTNRGINRYDRNVDSWSARTQDDGLSHPIVSAIAVEDEYIWIGTHGGVNRYSKITDSWNTYSTRDGLVDNFVTTISVTDNYAWFGTYRAGISVYSKTNQTFMKPYTKSDVLATDDIRSIAIDGNNVWIGTANEGAHRYIEAVDTWVRYTRRDGLASNHISWITAYKNEIWLGTYDSGVSLYDKVRNRWITFARADSPPEDYVRAIVQSSSGNFWIATPGGLMRYDPGIEEWTRYGKKDGLSTDYITSLEMDEGLLWIGTARGLASFDEGTGQWQFYNNTNGLTEDFVTSLRVAGGHDSDKTIWVGTNKGLFRGNANGQSLVETFENVPDLSGYRVTSIQQESHQMWIGTDKGLWEYDAATGQGKLYTTEHGLIDNYVNCVLIQDQVWLGTRGGIGIYDKGADAWRTISEGLPSRNIRALMGDPEQGIVWAGTTRGLLRVPDDFTEFQVVEPLTVSITSISRLSDDLLLLGTTSGLLEQNVSSGTQSKYRAFVTRQPLLEASAANIEFDGDRIWFSNWSASHNGAIVCYDRQNDTWRRFTRETILGDTGTRSPTIVKWICADDKWVWFATDYGVLQYDKLADTWEHFTTGDGLLSNNVRCVESTDNAVWVCPEIMTRLNRYDKKDGMWSEVKLSHLMHPRNYVHSIEADGDSLWVTISSSGVRRIGEDGQQRVYTRADGLAQMGARCLNVDEDYVWVAHWKDRGSGTLSRYDKRAGEWTVYSCSDVLAGDMISRIVTGEEYTWIVYESWWEGCVTGYNRETGEWTTISSLGQVKEVREDGVHLWLAPNRGGIKRFHKPSGTWTTFRSGQGPLMDFVNQRALETDDKYVWVGTPAGVSRYDKERESWTNYTQRHNLSGERVQAVASDKRYVWCGTSQGISRYDKLYGTWVNLSRKKSPYTGSEALSGPEMKWRGGMMNDDITALAMDDRFLWVATRGGGGRYDKITDRWDGYGVWNGLPGMDVSCVVADGYDIWMGTNGGVGKFPRMSDDPNVWVSYTSGLEIKAGTMTKEYANTLVSNEVWAVAADRDYIWVGTMRGVSRYNKEADTWTTYTTENGLASNEVSSIYVDGKSVWFGSDNGVTMHDKETGKWVTYTADDGLASNQVTCIAGSRDAVWFGTFDAGLAKYDRKSGTWHTYSRKDGLAHDCVLSVSVDGGLIWIGTRQGLNRYDVSRNNWTTFTEYGDSEDELDMVSSKKSVERRITGTEVIRPEHRDLEIADINADPPGRDEEALNGEWVRIVNTTESPVDMTGFTLSDYAGHVYKFGALILPEGSEIRLFTGSGTDTSTSFYWGEKTPVWNNRGDVAYLRDGDGELVDIYSY